METILKFFANTQAPEDGELQRNAVISRTMLKIAVVSKFMLDTYQNHPDKLPKHGELWRCRIAKESRPGNNKGCFIVEPLYQVQEDDIVKLVPGAFDMKVVNKQLIIRPHPEFAGRNWMMPLQHKRLLTEEHGAYCIIVDLDATSLSNEQPQEIKVHSTS